MSAFLYGAALQFKLDIRSKSLLITCYVVPLLFYALMGGIFTSINPVSKASLIQSMTVMGISMGAYIGLPPSLVEVYSGDCRKMYQANGVPLYMGLISMFLSAFLHLFIMSSIIYLSAPLLFDAALPPRPLAFFGSLTIFIGVSLSIGSTLGLLMNNQTKLTMISQLLFLPSIMLTGIMFPADMLPQVLQLAGKLFPAAWGFLLMTAEHVSLGNLWPLGLMFVAAIVICKAALKGQVSA